MSSQKPHRIRVRVIDGNPREPNLLKSQQLGMPHLDIVNAKDKREFIICAVKEAHLEQVRPKLGAAGLEEMVGGDTNVSAPPSAKPANPQEDRRGGPQRHGGQLYHSGRREASQSNVRPLPGKPYGFVALPKELTTAVPIWHDGTGTEGRLSGEIRFELETLTPLLVGWERVLVGENRDEVWPVPTNIEGVGDLAAKKAVLCPLRAPWGGRAVIIPGDSLKGLLRHELGALFGAPMERVAERSYSFRPNSLFPKESGPRLIARLARVPQGGVATKPLGPAVGHNVRVPTRLELLPTNLKYDKSRAQNSNYYRFDDANGAPYRGGQGAGKRLNSKHNLHKKLTANPGTPAENVTVPVLVQEGYLATLRHLTDLKHGHFGERHPDVPKTVTGDAARNSILDAAAYLVFQPGDLIWVEWDTHNNCIVSLGWHYYYRWAYTDSVRRRSGGSERRGLFPLDEERVHDHEGAPKGLSPVRRLFGYTGDNDNEGSKGIGKEDNAQLMGRISVNAALEVVADGTDDQRFLPPTFLKELGMPRPSAVEHYIQQPHHPNQRPSDRATLATYGDAAGYDEPGDLAGRKFYLDRADAYTDEPWKDKSEANRLNDRSILALEASRPGRRFRFTVRFRDLDPDELAAVLLALCPHQFREDVRGEHGHGYCSKLGYARPLGWGTVRIEARELYLLTRGDRPRFDRQSNIRTWFQQHFQALPMLPAWLDVHRHKHPDAADYPRKDGKIYTFHTSLRAEHARWRRYERLDGG